MSVKIAKSAALTTEMVIKAGPGLLYGLTGWNNSEQPVFVQVHDSVGEPTPGATPVFVIRAAPQAAFSLSCPGAQLGIPFENGIFVGLSTVGNSWVGLALQYCLFQGLYI